MFNTKSISSWAWYALEIAKRSSSAQPPGLLRPPDDILSEPHLTPSASRSPDGLGEIVVASSIHRQAIGIRQPDELGDVMSIEQIVQVDEASHDDKVVAISQHPSDVVI